MRLILVISLLIGLSTQIEYKRGLTDDFIGWLNTTGYEPYGFNRTEFFGGSFGGREYEGQPIINKPVIFIHGDGDQIIGDGFYSDGFRHSIEYFLSRGYTKAELYGSMWGFDDIYHMPSHRHHMEYVMYIRNFIEAVLEYTGAESVSVITHSMGCTLARKALKGGWSNAYKRAYYIGEPLYSKIDTYISIAGGHMGNGNCLNSTRLACSQLNGFYPGDQDGNPFPNQSTYLYEMNVDPQKEAQNTFAIWSWDDQSGPTKVHGRIAFEWPTMDASYAFKGEEWTHVAIRDNTTELQYNLVNYHKFIVNETNQDNKISFLQ